jgi:hypothetical protein
MPSAASNNAPAGGQRIPAWKRLGLKLKSAQETTEPAVVEPPRETDTFKRKRPDIVEGNVSSKKLKKASQIQPTSIQGPATPKLARKKSVTFTPETKVEDGDSIKQLFNGWVADQKAQDPSFELKSSNPVFKTPEALRVEEQIDNSLDEKDRRVKRVKEPKPEKGAKSKVTAKSKPNSKIEKSASAAPPFLLYLRQYHESRDTWKFNKAHQIHLLKHAFDMEKIPSDHTHFLYEYVRGLQGGVRTRLRDFALQIKVKDQEDGLAGFPANMADKDKRQREYDAAMNEYVATMTAAEASPNMGYEEGILLGLSDKAMEHRVAKRIRAEQILAELGQEGTSMCEAEAVNGEDETQKRLRMNDGSSQKIARKRKQRTIIIDDNTSSSGSSSSDSDSSENDASSDDETVTARDDEETSSSPSSSSSSSSESEDSEEDSVEDSDESDDE